MDAERDELLTRWSQANEAERRAYEQWRIAVQRSKAALEAIVIYDGQHPSTD